MCASAATIKVSLSLGSTRGLAGRNFTSGSIGAAPRTSLTRLQARKWRPFEAQGTQDRRTPRSFFHLRLIVGLGWRVFENGFDVGEELGETIGFGDDGPNAKCGG